MSLQSKKELTAAFPHRLMNKTSIYLAKQQLVNRSDFQGYEAVVDLGSSGTITVQSKSELTPHSGKIFDYVLNQWQALASKQDDLEKFELDISEVVQALGNADRTENRRKVLEHLNVLTDVTIIYDWGSGSSKFHLLEEVKPVDGTLAVDVKLSSSYDKALDTFRPRYMNIQRAMKLKSRYAIELGKLLQMDGQGVDRNGQPKPKAVMDHKRICDYLHLDHGSEPAYKEIRRAFNELTKNSYPKYSYNGRRDLWIS